MFLATRCGACDEIGPSPCVACAAALHRCPPVAVPDGLDACRVLLRYEGPARELVARLKYRNHRSSVPWIADALAGLVVAERPPPQGHGGEVGGLGGGGASVEVVTWAPTTAARRRARGFDHAELLARRVAGRLGLPCRRLLSRAAGPPQTGRSGADRRVGPVFEPLRSVTGRSVLLVDDVVTTGATMAAAGRALRSAGAGRIVGLAVAHPPGGGRGHPEPRPSRGV